jgi:hypothetical protein
LRCKQAQGRRPAFQFGPQNGALPSDPEHLRQIGGVVMGGYLALILGKL